ELRREALKGFAGRLLTGKSADLDRKRRAAPAGAAKTKCAAENLRRSPCCDDPFLSRQAVHEFAGVTFPADPIENARRSEVGGHRDGRTGPGDRWGVGRR